MKTRSRHLALIGAMLLSCSFIGSYLLVRDLFSSLSDATSVRQSFHPSASVLILGLGLPIIGFLVFAWALLKQSYRAPWMFWFMSFYGLAFVGRFPIGSIVGGLFIFGALFYRAELFSHSAEPDQEEA